MFLKKTLIKSCIFIHLQWIVLLRQFLKPFSTNINKLKQCFWLVVFQLIVIFAKLVLDFTFTFKWNIKSELPVICVCEWSLRLTLTSCLYSQSHSLFRILDFRFFLTYKSFIYFYSYCQFEEEKFQGFFYGVNCWYDNVKLKSLIGVFKVKELI